MEPPKKRKYPELSFTASSSSSAVVSSGSACGLTVESTSSSSDPPAKRNRRSYSLEFKVSVLDSYYSDTETKLNQRKTALKYGVNRRQIQKWLAQEEVLRGSVGAGYTQNHSLGQVPPLQSPASQPPLVTSTCRVSPANKNQCLQNKSQCLQSPPVKVKPEEVDDDEESEFVIDEQHHPRVSFNSGDFSDEDETDSKPINLCKVKDSKPLDHQVGFK